MEQNARIGFMLAQLGVRNPLPAAEVKKLLRQRQQMGLSHPGESAEFCAVCGVCHNGNEHAPTLWLSNTTGAPARGADVGLLSDATAIRDLVAQIVHKTLGSSHLIV
jgi:hypothetical protein